jgi:hypothetical protein
MKHTMATESEMIVLLRRFAIICLAAVLFALSLNNLVTSVTRHPMPGVSATKQFCTSSFEQRCDMPLQ